MKRAIVAGASRGIGLELVKRLCEEGFEVLALCRTPNQELAKLPAQVIDGVDVRDLSQLQGARDRVKEKEFDLLICNAGINKRMTIDDLDFLAMEELFAVNAIAPLKVVETFLPLLHKGSKIALISSRAGSIGDLELPGRYGYRASKTALNMIGAVLAMDLKERGIAVGLYHPGYVQTDMTEKRGDVSPQKAAHNLVERIGELSLDNSGQFFHAAGGTLPW